MSDNKHITINIGPQDSESWLFVAAAIAFCAFMYMLAQTKDPNDVEIERIRAAAHAKP